MSDDELSQEGDAGDNAGADSYFIKGGEGHLLLPFPGVAIRTTSGDQIMLSVVTIEAGSVVPEHSHPHEQMGMMISGKLEFTIGGVTRIVEPGDLWRIPGNVPHSVRTVEGPAVALDVFHPIRDDYR